MLVHVIFTPLFSPFLVTFDRMCRYTIEGIERFVEDPDLFVKHSLSLETDPLPER